MVIFKDYIVDEDGCVYKISQGDSPVELVYHEENNGKKRI